MCTDSAPNEGAAQDFVNKSTLERAYVEGGEGWYLRAVKAEHRLLQTSRSCSYIADFSAQHHVQPRQALAVRGLVVTALL